MCKTDLREWDIWKSVLMITVWWVKGLNKPEKTKRYTQAQLAEIIDMSSKNFSQIERGETGISLTTLMSLCKVLDVSADYILFGTQGGKSSIDLILSELNEEQHLYAEKMLEVYADYCKKHK